QPSTNAAMDGALQRLVKNLADAFLISPESLFVARRVQLIPLAVRHTLPALYHRRELAEAGGLMSYGSDLQDQYRLAAVYVGRILKGEKPAEMPVQLPTKFEFVINLQTAKTIGLEGPPTLLAPADEVIEWSAARSSRCLAAPLLRGRSRRRRNSPLSQSLALLMPGRARRHFPE